MNKNLRLKKIIKNLIREELEKQNLYDIRSDIEKNFSSKKCVWDLSASTGIKILFDVEGLWGNIRSFSMAGVSIIVGNWLKFLKDEGISNITSKIAAATHTGFIFSDGTVFHASSGREGAGEFGLGFTKEYTQKIINNPQNYLILDLGGDENQLRNLCEKTLEISKSQDTNKLLTQELGSHKIYKGYDYGGIIRQMQQIVGNGKIGQWVAALQGYSNSKESHPYSFFCSELVANLLMKLNIIQPNYFNNFKSFKFPHENPITEKEIKENLDALEKVINEADEVSPSELFKALAKYKNTKVLASDCKQ